MTYYDRKADIVYVEIDGGAAARSREYEWGLVDLDGSGRTLGFECWDASHRFPAELLDALPEPAEEDRRVARQPA